MADYSDIANNNHIQDIAKGIRTVTRTIAPMTIPQMPARLMTIRVVERVEAQYDCSSGDRVLLGTYDANISHWFLVTPKTNEDAAKLAEIEPQKELEYDTVTGELWLTYNRPRPVPIELVIIDMLLPNGAEAAGTLLIDADSKSVLSLYDEEKAYEEGELFIHNGTVAYTVTAHEPEVFTNAHNILLGTLADIQGVKNAKLDKDTSYSDVPKVYVRDIGENPTQGTVEFTPDVGAGFAVRRTIEGQIIVPKAPVDKAHTTSKEYVDTSIATEQGRAEQIEQGLETAIGEVADRTTKVESKIPNQATAENKLADKAFVNSTVSTQTATFRGTFKLIDDLLLPVNATHPQVAQALKAKITGATNNDYVFVIIDQTAPAVGVLQYDRYKYSTAADGWEYEYTLNNSSFTARQWEAINSGITAEQVNALINNATKDYVDGRFDALGTAALEDSGAFYSATAGGALEQTVSGLATEISDEVTNRQTAVGQALTDAKEYADTQDAATLLEAKSHTQDECATLKDDMQEYADTQATAAQSNAEGYTDSAITGLIDGATTPLDTLKGLQDWVSDGTVNEDPLISKVTGIEGDIEDIINVKLPLKEGILPDKPTQPESKFLNGNREWATVEAGIQGGGSNLYLGNTASALVGTYKKLAYELEPDTVEISKAIGGSSRTLIHTYLYDTPTGAFETEVGTWQMCFHCKISSTEGESKFVFEVFKRDTESPNTETTLFEFETAELDNTDYERVIAKSTQPNFSLSATESIGVKVYGQVSTLPNKTFSYKIGDGFAANFGIPVAIKHSQLRDLNTDEAYQHINSTDRTNLDNIKPVATSGEYDDLENKPSVLLYTKQTLQASEQAQARENIGAGDSSFSGEYGDLEGLPEIDRAMLSFSTNAVQNKVIKRYVDDSTAYLSNPNLLINGDFRVNQRGLTRYTAGNVYTVDRWKKCPESIVTVGADYLDLAAPERPSQISQYLETDLIVGQSYVMFATFNGARVQATGIATAVGYFINTYVKGGILRVNYDSTHNRYRLTICNNAPGTTLRIKDVKLELGEVATPFYPRPYAEELELCKYYYRRVRLQGLTVPASRNTALYPCVSLGHDMRVKPTLTVINDYDIRGEGINFVNTGSSMTVAELKGSEIVLQVEITSGTERFVIFKMYSLMNGTIALDAEI